MSGEWNRFMWTYDPITSGHTSTNILNVFASALRQSGWATAPWSTNTIANPEGGNAFYFLRTDRLTSSYWVFNGDGWTQNCGICVRYNTPDRTVRIHAFIENSDSSGSQRRTGAAGDITLRVDNTAPNNYTIVCGEAGLYVEVGRDGIQTNLGHGFLATQTVNPDMHGWNETTVGWISQGLPMDFYGTLKFTTDRRVRFIPPSSGNHNITAALAPFACRGAAGVHNRTMSNDARYYIAPRDALMNVMGSASYGPTGVASLAALGIPWGTSNGVYRLSPVYLDPGATWDYMSQLADGDADQPPYQARQVFDYRDYRLIQKLAVVDHTVLPNTMVTDLTTKIQYRIQRIEDNGRYCCIGIEWPVSNYLPVSP